MQTEQFKVTGMSCGGCISKVTHALQDLPGVDGVEVTLATGQAAIHYDEQRSSPEQLKAAVKAAGYGVDAPATAEGQPSKGGCCG